MESIDNQNYNETPKAESLFRKKAFWLTIIVIIMFGVVLVVRFSHHSDVKCTGIEIRIDSIPGGTFFTENDVRNLLKKNEIELNGQQIVQIDKEKIEALVQEIPAVKGVEVYSDNRGILTIAIVHRKPVARIYNSGSQSYYIDSEGLMLKTSDRFTSNVLIVNGNIHQPYDANMNLSDSLTGTEKPEIRLLHEIYRLALFIHANEFWNAQIEQVYIDDNDDIQLIPRVGKQTILLGEISGFEDKFKNLKLIYEEGFSKFGWDTFETINLKYKGQVVCATSDAPEIDQPDTIRKPLPLPEISDVVPVTRSDNTASQNKKQTTNIAAKTKQATKKTESATKNKVNNTLKSNSKAIKKGTKGKTQVPTGKTKAVPAEKKNKAASSAKKTQKS